MINLRCLGFMASNNLLMVNFMLFFFFQQKHMYILALPLAVWNSSTELS